MFKKKDSQKGPASLEPMKPARAVPLVEALRDGPDIQEILAAEAELLSSLALRMESDPAFAAELREMAAEKPGLFPPGIVEWLRKTGKN